MGTLPFYEFKLETHFEMSHATAHIKSSFITAYYKSPESSRIVCRNFPTLETDNWEKTVIKNLERIENTIYKRNVEQFYQERIYKPKYKNGNCGDMVKASRLYTNVFLKFKTRAMISPSIDRSLRYKPI